MPSPSPQPHPPANRDDEWIAVVVALGALGAVLGWALTQAGWFQGAQTIPSDRPEQLSQSILERTNKRLLRQVRLESESVDPTTRARLSDSPEQREPKSSQQTGLARPEIDEAESIKDAAQSLPVPANPQQQSLTVPDPPIPPAENPTERPPENLQPPLAFSDVAPDHWAKRYIDALTGQRILAGFPDGTFGPDQAMTRAEFSAQLVQAFELSAQTDDLFTFSDLPSGYWATDVIHHAVGTGFMKGYPDGIFQPGQTVPRAQVMAAIASGLKLSPPADSAGLLDRYQDSAEVPTWAQDPIAAVISAGLVTGELDQAALRPNQPATRAEVATLLYHALVYLGELPPLD